MVARASIFEALYSKNKKMSVTNKPIMQMEFESLIYSTHLHSISTNTYISSTLKETILILLHKTSNPFELYDIYDEISSKIQILHFYCKGAQICAEKLIKPFILPEKKNPYALPLKCFLASFSKFCDKYHRDQRVVNRIIRSVEKCFNGITADDIDQENSILTFLKDFARQSSTMLCAPEAERTSDKVQKLVEMNIDRFTNVEREFNNKIFNNDDDDDQDGDSKQDDYPEYGSSDDLNINSYENNHSKNSSKTDNVNNNVNDNDDDEDDVNDDANNNDDDDDRQKRSNNIDSMIMLTSQVQSINLNDSTETSRNDKKFGGNVVDDDDNDDNEDSVGETLGKLTPVLKSSPRIQSPIPLGFSQSSPKVQSLQSLPSSSSSSSAPSSSLPSSRMQSPIPLGYSQLSPRVQSLQSLPSSPGVQSPQVRFSLDIPDTELPLSLSSRSTNDNEMPRKEFDTASKSPVNNGSSRSSSGINDNNDDSDDVSSVISFGNLYITDTEPSETLVHSSIPNEDSNVSKATQTIENDNVYPNVTTAIVEKGASTAAAETTAIIEEEEVATAAAETMAIVEEVAIAAIIEEATTVAAAATTVAEATAVIVKTPPVLFKNTKNTTQESKDDTSATDADDEADNQLDTFSSLSSSSSSSLLSLPPSSPRPLLKTGEKKLSFIFDNTTMFLQPQTLLKPPSHPVETNIYNMKDSSSSIINGNQGDDNDGNKNNDDNADSINCSIKKNSDVKRKMSESLIDHPMKKLRI